jgi:hypothetical protein
VGVGGIGSGPGPGSGGITTPPHDGCTERRNVPCLIGVTTQTEKDQPDQSFVRT